MVKPCKTSIKSLYSEDRMPHASWFQDVYMADALVSQVETAVGRKKKLGFGLIIEATMGSLALSTAWSRGACPRNLRGLVILYVPSGWKKMACSHWD